MQATHVFLVEPVVNMGLEMQAISRVHRIGQTEITHVHRHIISDTVEELVSALSGKVTSWPVDKKKNAQDDIEEDGALWCLFGDAVRNLDESSVSKPLDMQVLEEEDAISEAVEVDDMIGSSRDEQTSNNEGLLRLQDIRGIAEPSLDEQEESHRIQKRGDGMTGRKRLRRSEDNGNDSQAVKLRLR